MKSVRHINTTPKHFIDTETRQFLVDHSFLVIIPSGLQRNQVMLSVKVRTHAPFPEETHPQ